MIKNRHCSEVVFVAFVALLLLSGCSSWGGKMRNTEGVRYYSSGNYDEALASFQTASRLNPDDPQVYYNIASTYQQQATRNNQPALLTQAENYYRQCLEKNPDTDTTVCCYRGLATVLNQKKNSDEAMALLRSWEERNPTSVEPKLEIAYLLEAQGSNQDAAAALEKIAAYAPNDYRAFYKLGLVREKLGQNDAALQQLRAASRLAPNDTEITERIARLESKMNPDSTMLAGNGTTQNAAPENQSSANAAAPPLHSAPKPTDPNYNVAATAPTLDDPITGNKTTQIPQTQATGSGPAYGAPAAGAAGASPIGEIPPNPPADPASAPAAPTTFNPPANSFPDGTGANPFNLAPSLTSTPPAALPAGTNASAAPSVPANSTASVAPTLTASAPAAAQSTAPTAAGNRKQRIGETPNTLPVISVGAPF